jgi:hypothetical protein
MDGGITMEIIRDYKQLKLLDKNISYNCVGFSRPYIFHPNHNHLYENLCNNSINKADKLIGLLWDNENDLQIFMNQKIIQYEFDEVSTIKWFEEKGFDYLFIPDSSFMIDLLNLPRFQEVIKEVDRIWEIENYESLLGTDFFPGNKSWLKLLLSRGYFFYSDRNDNEKIINRTYQTTAPDGTWGFITIHFWKKYCSDGEFPLVPILRKENGLAFDVNIEKRYPQEVKDIFDSFIIPFNSFKSHRDCEILKEDIKNILRKEYIKHQKYFFYSLDYFCNEITLNKYILKLQIRGNFIRSNERYDIWRIWEYEEGL